MRRSFFILLFSLTAAAQGFDRAALERSVKQARTEAPEVFSRVRAVVAQADTLQRQSRGRLFPFPARFRAVTHRQPGAAFALAEPLFAPERFPMPVVPEARLALRAGLLEAAGSLHEPSLAPLYRSFLAGDEPREVVRAAAEALAKLGDDEDSALLARLATQEGPQQDAAISALGSAANGKVAVTALTSLTTAPLEAPRAKLVAGSLARVAPGWRAAVPWRADAAKGALALFVTARSGEVRTAASDALMTIDAPQTPELIAAARAGASPELLTALDALSDRFAHNPTRGHR